MVTTAKQVYSFTHFDIWGYGTNFFTISMYKSDHNDPGGALHGFGVPDRNVHDRKYRYGYWWQHVLRRRNRVLRPVPFDLRVERNLPAPRPSASARCITFRSKSAPTSRVKTLTSLPRSAMASSVCNFAFDLPYKGFFNVAPLAYKEINRNAFAACQTLTGAAGCNVDGNVEFNWTWAVEVNYYMDLGFCPRTGSTSRSAVVRAGMDRRATTSAPTGLLAGLASTAPRRRPS